MTEWPVTCGCCQRGAPDGWLIRCDETAELNEREHSCGRFVPLDAKQTANLAVPS